MSYLANNRQERRPTRFVLGVGISNHYLFRQILWTARTLHEASEAISLVSNPSFSEALIKICCAASSCGTMIADMLTLAGGRVDRQIPLCGQGCTVTSAWKWTPLKIIN